MSVYIIFSLCILLVSRHTFKHTLLFISIVVYQTFTMGYTGVFPTMYQYIMVTTSLSFIVGWSIYDTNKVSVDWMWVFEVVPLLILKLIEILFIISPVFYIPSLKQYYLSLDGYFIGGVLFVMYCREVGYNPFKYNFNKFSKYILSVVVSLIFIYNHF